MGEPCVCVWARHSESKRAAAIDRRSQCVPRFKSVSKDADTFDRLEKQQPVRLDRCRELAEKVHFLDARGHRCGGREVVVCRGQWIEIKYGSRIAR